MTDYVTYDLYGNVKILIQLLQNLLFFCTVPPNIKMMYNISIVITTMAEAYISAMIKPITSKIDSNKDWSDIVRDKIVPYLENPFSHKIGTEEEKQGFYDYILIDCPKEIIRVQNIKTPYWFKRMAFLTTTHKKFKGKTRINMNLEFRNCVVRTPPADYNGDNPLLQAVAGSDSYCYTRTMCEPNNYLGSLLQLSGQCLCARCNFEFRKADDCTKQFLRNGGQIMNKENVWNAYMKISKTLNQIKNGSLCQHTEIKDFSVDHPTISFCNCPKWTKNSKYCVMHSHDEEKHSHENSHEEIHSDEEIHSHEYILDSD